MNDLNEITVLVLACVHTGYTGGKNTHLTGHATSYPCYLQD